MDQIDIAGHLDSRNKHGQTVLKPVTMAKDMDQSVVADGTKSLLIMNLKRMNGILKPKKLQCEDRERTF